MFKLAWRNLFHDRTRLAISVGGVALAIVLILVMSGIFGGSEEHAVIYIRNQPAALWMMQADVENIHMASSILPPDAINRVKQVEGVQEAVGVLYATAPIEVGDAPVASYLFGIEPDAPFGGPWSLAEGTTRLGLRDIIIDRVLARRYDLGIGDKVNILGFELTIAGLSNGTFGIATNIAFVNKTALALALGVSPQASSYILIQPKPGTHLDALTQQLRRAVPESNVISQPEFIQKEQELIRQMGADVLLTMSTIAYIIGLLVIGLTIYTATLERAREYGVFKALGANNRQLVSVVFGQALTAVGLGFFVGVGLAYATAWLVGRALPEILILIEPSQWLGKIPVLAVIAALAAFAPINRIMRLDPMVVFRA